MASRTDAGEIVDGRYKLERLLGRGGMGQVFAATDLRLKRKVAIKFLNVELQSEPEILERFLREARAAAALDHPNVIPVYAAGEHRGRPFIAMRYIEGETLAERVASQGALPLASVLEMGLQVCAGLQAIHDAGFVHRDIKPANLMWDSAAKRVVILDFGVLRTEESDHTRTGMVVGTRGYMPPEQATDARQADGRSDLYALAATLFYCRTGAKPFDGPSVVAIVMKQQEGPPSMAALKHEGPLSLANVLTKALHPNPAQRYATVREMSDALASVRESHASVTSFDATMGRSSDTVARVEEELSHRRQWAAVWMLSAALILGGLLFWWLARTPDTNEGSTPEPASAGAAALDAPLPALDPFPSAPRTPPAPAAATVPPPQPTQTADVVTPARRHAPALDKPKNAGGRGERADRDDDESERAAEVPAPSGSPSPPTAPPPAAPSLDGREPVAPAQGRLRVVTREKGKGSWSEISIDGKIYGHTHAVVRALPSGAHRVRVRREGYEEIEREVHVREGQLSEVIIELRRKP